MCKIFLMVVFAICSVVKSLPYNGAKHLVPTLDGRIIGGADADISDYPYQLSLQHGSYHICGAAIIHPNYAVTAAHCTDGASASDLKVRAGSSTMGSGGQIVRVRRIFQHPEYTPSIIDFDISVLELASAIILGDNAQVIGLPEPDTKIKVNSTAVVTGWGTTKESGSTSRHLQVVYVPVVSRKVCQNAYGRSAITERMFCAGHVGTGGKDACQGDSGGPLVVDGLLTGIVSWGYGCARPQYPGVYSKVSSLRNFIRSVSSI